jgi:predicted acyltransferase
MQICFMVIPIFTLLLPVLIQKVFVVLYQQLLLRYFWLPINKNLWTSSYAVFTSGMALVVFSCCYWLVDVKGYQKWFKPLQIYGLNALTIFVMSGLVGRLINLIKVTGPNGASVSLKSYYYNFLFSSFSNQMLASFLHAIIFVLLMYLAAYILYRAKLIIKI